MGKRKKKKKYNNYIYGYRTHDFYNDLTYHSYAQAKSEQINKIALEVFGSLHYTLDADD